MLTLNELRELRAKSAWRGGWLVAHAWATVAGAMVLYAAWPSAITLVLAIVVIGSRQLGLLVLMHDAAHWLLLPQLGANTVVGSWLCGYPVIAPDLKTYRRTHHLHHRHTGGSDDPDLALAAALPLGRARLWWAIVRDLSGWTAAARVVTWPGWRAPLPEMGRRLRGPLLGQTVLFAVLAGLGAWHLYLLLWLLPLATWHQLVVRVRGIAEHAMVPETRTTTAGPLARALLAPYWVNYHVEHHALVFVPCWNLRRAHALLVANGYADTMELAPGYLNVLHRAMSAPPAHGRTA